MNSKIEQLAAMADFGGIQGDDVVYDRRLEKFANLIIEECASLFPMTFTDERYQRRIDNTIRKHFEV